MNYKKIVKEKRKKLIITQVELAELLGVSFSSINRWETGKHEPTTKIKRKLVEICKTV
jgi:DNA-binding XRE family transcriptional regulator